MNRLTSAIRTIKRALGPVEQEVQLYADDEFVIIYKNGGPQKTWIERQREQDKHEWKTTK